MSSDSKANDHFLIEAHGNLAHAIWADGPFCPHCGEREAIRTIHGQTTRPGIYHCLTCRKRFAGTLDILFQDTRIKHYQAKPGAWLSGGAYVGPKGGARGYAAYAVWYLGHIVRQFIMGSDVTPPPQEHRDK